MFSNFRDAFISKPQFTTRIPESVLETISKGLPEGFRYVEDQNGFCHLDCDGTLDIIPESVRLPPEARPIFDEKGDYTINSIMAYAYNAQKSIELVPDKDGNFSVNGERIKLTAFVAAPMKHFTMKQGRLFVLAQPFPPPYLIEVAGNGYSLQLKVQRQPMNSISVVKIASVGKAPLSISYTFVPTKKNGAMTINLKTCPSDSAAEILKAKEIFNAFMLGEGTLCGARIRPNDSKQNKRIPDATLRFLRRIVAVENALGIRFHVQQDITVGDVKMVDKLYRCFAEKRPFKEIQKDVTINGIGAFGEDRIPCDQEILFEYVEEEEINLLGIPLHYHALVDVFGGAVSELETPTGVESGEFHVKILPVKGKQLYTSIQYYLDEETLETVRNDRDHVRVFQNAEELDKY